MTPAPPWMAIASGRGSTASAGATAAARHRSASSLGRDIVSPQRYDRSALPPARTRARGLPNTATADLRVKPATPQRIRSLLVANRGEIAIRVMRAASELGLRTVAIYSQEDRFSLHRTKADEAYLIGAGGGPVEAYLDIAGVLALAREARVDAIHPGYGFLSENPEFARATREAGLTFIGPEAETMRLLGNTLAARDLAAAAGVAVMPATPALPADLAECRALARGRSEERGVGKECGSRWWKG